MAQPGTLVFGERVNEDFIRESSQNLPSIADVLGAHAAYGFNEILPFQLARLATYRASSYLPGLASEPLNSEEWVNSEFFRDGLNFVEGMNRLYAFQLASEFDKRKAWEEVIERGPQGAEGFAVGIAGSLLGGVPDPVNYFPIIGAGSKTRIINRLSKFTRQYIKNPAKALKLGRTAGSAVAGGLDAGLATALITPVFVAERVESQDDISTAAVITNIAIATGIGTGFGTVGNVMGRKLRHRTLMAAHQRSVGQIVDGKNVDVGVMVQKELAESPLVTKADGVENLRYDVATDAPVIRNADSIKAENDLKLVIAKQVPAEDITFTKTLDDARTNPEAFEDLDVELLREKPTIREAEAVVRPEGIAEEVSDVQITGLKRLGFPDKEIARVKPEAAEKLIAENTSAKKVDITQEGDAKVREKPRAVKEEVEPVPEEVTQVPSERVEADPTAEIDRQVQEHLDTADRISKEVDQEQTLLSDYIRCITEE